MRNNVIRLTSILVVGSVVAGLWPDAARAQLSASDEAGVDIADIIVTAQKRAQNVQDVPIAVSAFGAEQLASAGVTSSSDLTFVTPGLNVSRTLNFAQPVIRGVGSASTSPGDEANVATYVDGVYIAQMTAGFYDFNSITAIEVLKGPQGTLFGRNATGGAVNVTTRDPGADPRFDAEATYGRFNERTVKAYASGGSQSVAANISFIRSKRDGYIRDIGTGRDEAGWDKTLVRGKLLFQPSDAIRIVAAADYADIADNSGVIVSPIDGNTLGRATFPVPTGRYEASQSFPQISKIRQYGASLKGEFDLGAVRLVSISAYRRNKVHIVADTDASAAPFLKIDNTDISRTFSQELQLLSDNGSNFNWIVGGFYFRNRAGHEPLIVNTTSVLRAQQLAESVAAFADGTYDVTPSFSVTAGLRYSREKRTLSGTRNNLPVAGIPVSKTYEDVAPRLVLSYKPTDESLLYGSYSKGFKSGTFNVSAFLPGPVDPEKLTAYEIGYKTKIGRSVTWNSSMFHYDYRDLQVQVLTAGSLATLQNAANARMNGFDTEFAARVSNRFSFRVAVAYIDAKYKDYEGALITIPRPTGGNTQVARDVSGNRLIRTPDITVTLGGNYIYPLADGSSIELSGNLYFSGDYFWDVGNRLTEKSYEVLNSQLTWRSSNERFRVTIWGRNLTNAAYREQVATSSLADYGRFAAPRQYGVTLGLSYP